MKLFIAPRAPNPCRVTMFIAENGIEGIERVPVDLSANEHKSEAFAPRIRWPGCRRWNWTMGACWPRRGPSAPFWKAWQRAFIEMADRRVEWYLSAGIANCVRHTHPGLAALEQPQFPEFGHSQGQKMREVARWLDGQLANQPFIGGQRFTIADITAFCALEFARGLLKFSPSEEGMPHLQAYRDRIADRPGARALP